jgi:hypothetical protein
MSPKNDNPVKSRPSRAMPAGRQEGGNPCVRNVLKRMDSRLRNSGMTALNRTFYDIAKNKSGFVFR